MIEEYKIMARFNAAFARIKIMFSRIRGLISCQSNTQTIAPTISPPSSGHVSFAGLIILYYH